jgi:hypothetical protein
MSGDDGMDDDAAFRWMTYAELGQSRGISTASATRLAFRRKWRRQVGNDKIARVAVPAGEDKPASDVTRDDRDDIRGGVRGDILHLLSALEGAISIAGERKQADAATIVALREQLTGTADERDRERVRADRADQALAGERLRADGLRDRLEATNAELRAAQEATEALRQAEHARKARGRLRRAWDGWRGR